MRIICQHSNSIMFSNIDADILGRIEAMRAQEDATSPRCNYFKISTTSDDIDKEGRMSLVIWLRKVQTALKLSPETVWIALSYLDRYLSSGKGASQEALKCRYKFQLAAITSFWIAVKIYESMKLNVSTLVKLCKGYYEESEIVSTEEDILYALDWRVTTPTPMEFVRIFMELLPRITKSSPIS